MKTNNRKILTGIGQFAGIPEDLLGGLCRSIDKLEKIGLEGVREELKTNQIPEDVIERLLELLQISGDNEAVLKELEKQGFLSRESGRGSYRFSIAGGSAADRGRMSLGEKS